MGGEIKVVKKNGPGTLMRLYLLLKTPTDGADLHCQVDFSSHNAVVSKITCVIHKQITSFLFVDVFLLAKLLASCVVETTSKYAGFKG
jgi:hypothetical protein